MEENGYATIQYSVIYSRRRTLGISVRPDGSVIVRVPYRTPDKTITRLVHDKASWIIRHRDNYISRAKSKVPKEYADGEKHLFRGNELNLRLTISGKAYYKLYDGTIELGLRQNSGQNSTKALLYAAYKNEACRLFPEMLGMVLSKNKVHDFRPSGLVIKTMKRRWGSCSGKGIITLNTELIKLQDRYIEYVISHELCHLKHHNHGPHFYELLSQIFPDWKNARKEMRNYIIE
jgi:predicted metal-dependent hydrolase